MKFNLTMKKLGWLIMSISPITLFTLAILWNIELPYDYYYKDGTLGFGSIHIVTNIFLVLISIASIIISVCVFDDASCGRNWNICKKEINIDMKKLKKVIFWLALVIILVIVYNIFSILIKQSIELYNTTARYKVEFNNKLYERELYYDKMWKTYLEKYNICELNKDVFIEVTKLIMDGRKDGEKLAWKWLQENQPIPYDEFSKFYTDLSKFTHSQREGYFKLEKECINIVNYHNILLNTFPNRFYNKFLDIEELEYKVGFMSDKTEWVFSSGIENI